MDKLGLEEPQTLEEAFDVIEAFQKNRMGAAPGEDSIGLVCDTSLVGTTSSSYSVDPIFQKFGAIPRDGKRVRMEKWYMVLLQKRRRMHWNI